MAWRGVSSETHGTLRAVFRDSIKKLPWTKEVPYHAITGPTQLDEYLVGNDIIFLYKRRK